VVAPPVSWPKRLFLSLELARIRKRLAGIRAWIETIGGLRRSRYGLGLWGHTTSFICWRKPFEPILPGAVIEPRDRMRLFIRKQCWAPTVRGWLVLVAIGLTALVFVARSIHSFLAVSNPVPADVLIVESWLPDSAFRGAVEECRRGNYRCVITTGLTLPEVWLGSKYKTGAEFAAANLVALALTTNLVVPIPAVDDTRDRTYLSALAVAKWLETARPAIRAVNIYTFSLHARRTRLLFRKALGNNVKVGVIAHPEDSYDAKHWWVSSNGFRGVADEGIAYLYARVLFHPGK
jgi:hypothetical protein